MVVEALGHVRRLVAENLTLDGKPGVMVPVIGIGRETVKGQSHDYLHVTLLGLGHPDRFCNAIQLASALTRIQQQVKKENTGVSVSLDGSVKSARPGKSSVPEALANPDNLPIVEIRAKLKFLKNPTISAALLKDAQSRYRDPQ